MNEIPWKDILRKDALFARYDIITGERSFTKINFWKIPEMRLLDDELIFLQDDLLEPTTMVGDQVLIDYSIYAFVDLLES